ncbi:unnamed protein product [Tuber aestivum]|uniref:ubiquitinyl hydrolase 1 n=1 Tax=Tuber aestivum TaxID=59557 RepID=A0A292PU63_9PEZI|nr:unnamed protein product [Tuber aestivum]
MPRPAVPTSSIDPDVSQSLLVSLIVAGVFVVYNLLYELAGLPPLWELIFVMIPGLLLGPRARETLENAFGISTDGGLGIVARVRNRAASLVGGQLVPAGYSPDGEGLIGGLWNSGNTCYQNSVLQAMASLSHLKPYLASLSLSELEDGMTPSGALISLIADLNTLTSGPRASTPSPIIVRGTDNSGWVYNEQQDAQEFFQKLTGSLEKEVSRFLKRRKESIARGLESVRELEEVDGKKALVSGADSDAAIAKDLRSPFEGLFAQRVGCLQCGYVEAISLQPFTSLSLSLPSQRSCSLEECLSGFTAIEEIHKVDCDKCTILSLCNRLGHFLEPLAEPKTPSPTLQESTRLEMQQRLTALLQAIEEDNFSPNVPGVKISPKQKISSTKTKQTMIARPPPILVLHLNRSQYDIMTGLTGKNHAVVSFPARLDLGKSGAVTRHDTADGSCGLTVDPASPMSGCVPRRVEEPMASPQDSGDANKKMQQEDFVRGNDPEGVLYELKSVVVHHGGHHNGHYTCYRKLHNTWFKTSDHEVYVVEESTVLNIGKVFMLFYERLSDSHGNGNAKLGYNFLVNGGLGAVFVAGSCRSSEPDYGIDDDDEQHPNSNGTVIPPGQDFVPGSTSSSSTHNPEITHPTSPNPPPDPPGEASEDARTLVEEYLAALETYTLLCGTPTSTLFAGQAAPPQVETDGPIPEISTTTKTSAELNPSSSSRAHTFSPPVAAEPTTNSVRRRKGEGEIASANGSATSALPMLLRKAQEELIPATTAPTISSALQTLQSLETRIVSDSEASSLLQGRYKQRAQGIVT